MVRDTSADIYHFDNIDFKKLPREDLVLYVTNTSLYSKHHRKSKQRFAYTSVHWYVKPTDACPYTKVRYWNNHWSHILMAKNEISFLRQLGCKEPFLNMCTCVELNQLQPCTRVELGNGSCFRNTKCLHDQQVKTYIQVIIFLRYQ
jgi:hypothetical protein